MLETFLKINQLFDIKSFIFFSRNKFINYIYTLCWTAGFVVIFYGKNLGQRTCEYVFETISHTRPPKSRYAASLVNAESNTVTTGKSCQKRLSRARARQYHKQRRPQETHRIYSIYGLLTSTEIYYTHTHYYIITFSFIKYKLCIRVSRILW